MKRYSGEEYVIHTINVSIILSEMGVEENVILAGMLCDAAEKGMISLDECYTTEDTNRFLLQHSRNEWRFMSLTVWKNIQDSLNYEYHAVCTDRWQNILEEKASA